MGRSYTPAERAHKESLKYWAALKDPLPDDFMDEIYSIPGMRITKRVDGLGRSDYDGSGGLTYDPAEMLGYDPYQNKNEDFDLIDFEDQSSSFTSTGHDDIDAILRKFGHYDSDLSDYDDIVVDQGPDLHKLAPALRPRGPLKTDADMKINRRGRKQKGTWMYRRDDINHTFRRPKGGWRLVKGKVVTL